MTHQTAPFPEFVISWPIWAGGYPEQADVLANLAGHSLSLRDLVAEQLRHHGFEVSVDLDFQLGGYTEIAGLSPLDQLPNSVIVTVSASVPESRTRAEELTRRTDLVAELAGLIEGFARRWMRGARNGANLYCVTTRGGSEPPGPETVAVELWRTL